MTEQLFVYGTLRIREVQREIIGREVDLVADAVEGFATVPVVIDRMECRTLVPRHNEEVGGGVISVTKAELSRIDDYEPAEYKRISVTTVSGKTVWVYVKA